mmetsp:Transcript_23375/g.37418  ORF Transcript_23375/g.37418 Transcript_23375/m.37418 type:complete len:83 (+) Transcript_23375:93-341(+)
MAKIKTKKQMNLVQVMSIKRWGKNGNHFIHLLLLLLIEFEMLSLTLFAALTAFDSICTNRSTSGSNSTKYNVSAPFNCGENR